MNGEILRSRRGSGEDLAAPSPCWFDNTVPKILSTRYFSLPQLVANVEEERLHDIRNALHIGVDGTLYWYDDVLPSLQAAILTQRRQSYLSKEARCWYFIRWSGCSAVKRC